MFIKNFGLFWRRDEVDWYPGKGTAFRLLGHHGIKLPGVSVADFRDQHGIYILYGNHGPHYVGLTNEKLGNRLNAHILDVHANEWDRFSWFGFRTVLKSTDANGIRRLK